jgi:hypothetical protein
MIDIRESQIEIIKKRLAETGDIIEILELRSNNSSTFICHGEINLLKEAEEYI